MAGYLAEELDTYETFDSRDFDNACPPCLQAAATEPVVV